MSKVKQATNDFGVGGCRRSRFGDIDRCTCPCGRREHPRQAYKSEMPTERLRDACCCVCCGRNVPDLPDRRRPRYQEVLPRNLRRPYQVESACRQAVLNWVTGGCCLGVCRNWQFSHVGTTCRSTIYALLNRPNGYKESCKTYLRGKRIQSGSKDAADDIYWAENEQRGICTLC